MKKLFLSFTLLLISLLSFSQFKPDVSFEFGYHEEGYRIVQYAKDTSVAYTRIGPLMSEVNLGINWKGIRLYTVFGNYFQKAESFRHYKPLQTEYRIGLTYTYKFVTIELSHMCSHNVNSINGFDKYYDKATIKFKIL